MALPISPNLLVTLTLLLKTKSVSGTALALGVSQPSVSRSLSQLRTALKDPLLVRSGSGMARTQRGEELVGRLADWMATTSALLVEDSFDPARVERRFRVATTDFGVMSVLLPAVAALREEAPAVSIDIVPLSHAVHRALAEGEIDLAISGLDHDPSQLHRALLFEDEFLCVTRADHPLAASRDPVTVETFLAYPHLGLTVSEAELDRVAMTLGPAIAGRKVAASLPYFGLAPAMLAASNLVMVLPSRAAPHFDPAHGLFTRPAPAELGLLQYWLLWHERGHRDPASRWLRDRLIRICREHFSTAVPE
ncbi:LysR family transcriptional regulator [Novosphingobium sp.]|uniref:LysR family transcriptional regulator n=1 Tax=Novosphingobium sp. TaxID=1874826 RepID=UPI0028AE34D3|nr:LysR family transcriptional regulator [Novosphingobium sp.]